SAGRHTVSMTCDPAVSVCGAELELLSAFSNLASNAVRYTPDGGSIRLDWGVRDGHAVYSVTDTGIGIAPEHIPRLTERFYRVDRS
ncbi:ATP-binding protein, partial [Klebsiella pneumoniae]